MSALHDPKTHVLRFADGCDASEMLRLSPRLSNCCGQRSFERDSVEVVPHTGVGEAVPEGSIHAQSTTSDSLRPTREPEAEAVSQAVTVVALRFEGGGFAALDFERHEHRCVFSDGTHPVETTEDGGFRILRPVVKIEHIV